MNFLAIDLGAESGRAMLGALDRGRLTLEELHRFPNTPVQLPTGLHWDVLRLFHEIRQSLLVCGRQRSFSLDGVAVDTWGVDFGLLDAHGALLENPRHYRDARHAGMLEKTIAAVPRERIFEQTGIQFLHFNTLCQWYSMRLAGSPALGVARHLLFIPDLFNFWLTGVIRAELHHRQHQPVPQPRREPLGRASAARNSVSIRACCPKSSRPERRSVRCFPN